jgi:catechol 2,3-dioxygenase
MVRYGPSASFMSAGGYHHHLGLNTWAGEGAPSPPPDAVHLLWYEIVLPDTAVLTQLVSRLQSAKIPITQTTDGVYQFSDPASNGIRLVTS